MRNKAVELPPALSTARSPAARASDPSEAAGYTRDSCLRGMVSRENGLRKEFAPLGLSALNKHCKSPFKVSLVKLPPGLLLGARQRLLSGFRSARGGR